MRKIERIVFEFPHLCEEIHEYLKNIEIFSICWYRIKDVSVNSVDSFQYKRVKLTLHRNEIPKNDWLNFFNIENHSIIEKGFLEILQWLVKEYENTFDPYWVMWHSAVHGHLHIIQWLREIGTPWNLTACSVAAFNGHLHIIQWMKENGCPWQPWNEGEYPSNGEDPEYTCDYAIRGGHIDILIWARQHECPWNKQRCLQCAKDYSNGQIVDLIGSGALG